MALRNTLKRSLSTFIDTKGHAPPKDFSLFTDVFSIVEQRVLLAAALQKLDAAESSKSRRRRNAFIRSKASSPLGGALNTLNDIFLPDHCYQMEQGHYDGVIHNFREMHVSSWPDNHPELGAVLARLHAYYPSDDTHTHILHLASNGEILPHVDNLEASGSWILGVSLGSERVLRMQSTTDETDLFDVLLPSGSLYIQRNDVRYRYNHSVMRAGSFLGKDVAGGPRLSILIRDRFANEPSELN